MSHALEEKIAHLERVCDDLSGVVADQARRLALLERQVAALLEAERTRQADGGVTIGDERPPHW